MIKLLSAFDGPRLCEITPTETTHTLEQKLMLSTGENFKINLQETSNNRILPRDEVITDLREYYVNFLQLPGE